ncbi:CBS domain-containing protein [Streptosporangium sp. NPDC000509]|uniref:CBS domain-containing protein n=1 Tax=Streptosporangium sp. NPDC000509 TaxID=3366186 RepID=UPI00367B730D
MSTGVITVRENTAFREVAEILIATDVGGVPVVDEDDRVLGVVSETDLLRKEEFKQRYHCEHYRPPLRAWLRHRMSGESGLRRKAAGETAGELMSHPAVVITADSPVLLAARVMDLHGVRRLPVVRADGRLAGIVSRRDLIKVFVRSDDEIGRRIRENLVVHELGMDPAGVGIEVRGGLVRLSGQVDEHSQAVTLAQKARNLNGVVKVTNELTWRQDDVVPLSVIWGGA